MRGRTNVARWWLSSVLLASSPAVGSGCAGRSGDPMLAVGAPAPALRQRAHDGTEVDLTTLGGKPMLVYFYPKDGTPGCTRQACAIRDVWQRFAEAGVRVVGVSSDSDESHRAFAKEHALPFPLIADEQHVWASAFGVDTTLGMTSRDSFLIGPDGKVAKVYRGVDPGVHAHEVLADAKALGGADPEERR
jgi:thioredoxin-dependent peroxiredoxin